MMYKFLGVLIAVLATKDCNVNVLDVDSDSLGYKHDGQQTYHGSLDDLLYVFTKALNDAKEEANDESVDLTCARAMHSKELQDKLFDTLVSENIFSLEKLC